MASWTPGSAQRCLTCGDDRRGVDSDCCSECGAAIAVELCFADAGTHSVARDVLRAAGLLIGEEQAGGSLGPVGVLYGMPPAVGRLWVARSRRAEAVELLAQRGIATPDEGLPIIDRAEPVCFACNQRLDPTGPEVCSACGTRFQWVEIEELEGDPTGNPCD